MIFFVLRGLDDVEEVIQAAADELVASGAWPR
jgi:hypothetical protein